MERKPGKMVRQSLGNNFQVLKNWEILVNKSAVANSFSQYEFKAARLVRESIPYSSPVSADSST